MRKFFAGAFLALLAIGGAMGQTVRDNVSRVMVTGAAHLQETANDGTTGTTVNTLAKLTSTGAIAVGTGDTAVVAYLVVGGAGTTGSAQLLEVGEGLCKMDATTSNTEGFFVIASTTTAKDCHAQSAAPSAGVYVVGIMVDNSTTSGSNAKIRSTGFFMPGASSALGDPGSNGVPTRSALNTTVPAIADNISAPMFCQDAGSTDAYACTLSPAIAGYTTGTIYWFKANTANTGAATINFNSLGAKTIKKAVGGITTDLADNDIRVGQWVILTYDGTNMEMQSTLGNAIASALAANGSNCSAGSYPLGVDASGAVESCTDYGTETKTFTNKAYDAEGTGNTLTIPVKIWLPAAGANGSTAGSFWDLPTSTPAVAAVVTGTNTQKGVLQFPDTSGGFSAQTTLILPADFSGNIDARIIWRTSATSGNAKFSLSTICTDVAATATDDPAFNTASTVTTAAPGTTLRIQVSSIASVTATGCAAGNLLHLKLFRDGNDAADTISASLDVIGVELTIRRAM